MSEVVNNSGLVPLGVAVLVEPYQPDMESSVLVLPDNVRWSAILVDTKVRVLEVGPAAWKEEEQPRAKPGDVVFITKMAGYITQGADGKVYRLVNDRDVFCRVKGA